MAAALKINPVLMVAYWVLRGAWRPAMIALATAAILGTGSCFIVSWGECRHFALSILPVIGRGSPDFYNQSIQGFMARSLVDHLDAWTNLEALPASAIFRAATLALSAATVIVILRFIQPVCEKWDDQPTLRALEFTIALVTILIISPITWQHYFVWLVIVVPTLLTTVPSLKTGNRRLLSVWAVVALGLIWIPPNVLRPTAMDVAHHYSRFLGNLLMSSGLFGAFLLMGLLLHLHRVIAKDGSEVTG